MTYLTFAKYDLNRPGRHGSLPRGLASSDLTSRPSWVMAVVAMLLLVLMVVPVAIGATAAPVHPISGLLGKVESVTGDSVDIRTANGLVHVATDRRLTLYKQVPSDLSHVTASSYVGIPSVRREDGTEQAQLIMIFPKALRGAAEGSVSLDAAPGPTVRNRMTNGSVAVRPIAKSHMTNGTVQAGLGTTLTVRYQDGARTLVIPANVPVTAIRPVKATLAPGDTVYVATEKAAGGLKTDKIFLFIEAPRVSASR